MCYVYVQSLVHYTQKGNTSTNCSQSCKIVAAMWHISTLCQMKYKGLKHTKLALHVGKSVLLPCLGQCVSPRDRSSKFLSVLSWRREERRKRTEAGIDWKSTNGDYLGSIDQNDTLKQPRRYFNTNNRFLLRKHLLDSHTQWACNQTRERRKHPWLRFDMCDWCWRISVFYSEVLFSSCLKFHGWCSFFVWCWRSHSVFWCVAFVW